MFGPPKPTDSVNRVYDSEGNLISETITTGGSVSGKSEFRKSYLPTEREIPCCPILFFLIYCAGVLTLPILDKLFK